MGLNTALVVLGLLVTFSMYLLLVIIPPAIYGSLVLAAEKAFPF